MNEMTGPNKVTDRRTRADGWWYPYVYVALFAVVLAVNGVLIVAAVTGFGGLESEHAYEEGLAYNDRLAAAEAQAHYDWRVTVVETPDAAGQPARLAVAVTDLSGQPVPDAAVTAEVRRPSDAHLDRQVVLEAGADHVYGATVLLPVSGQWEARMTATRGPDVYHVRQRFIVP